MHLFQYILRLTFIEGDNNKIFHERCYLVDEPILLGEMFVRVQGSAAYPASIRCAHLCRTSRCETAARVLRSFSEAGWTKSPCYASASLNPNPCATSGAELTNMGGNFVDTEFNLSTNRLPRSRKLWLSFFDSLRSSSQDKALIVFGRHVPTARRAGI